MNGKIADQASHIPAGFGKTFNVVTKAKSKERLDKLLVARGLVETRAKAQALICGRDYVAPDDVQAILAQTIAHRLVPVGSAG